MNSFTYLLTTYLQGGTLLPDCHVSTWISDFCCALFIEITTDMLVYGLCIKYEMPKLKTDYPLKREIILQLTQSQLD